MTVYPLVIPGRAQRGPGIQSFKLNSRSRHKDRAIVDWLLQSTEVSTRAAIS
jgi:hypothetical protein